MLSEHPVAKKLYELYLSNATGRLDVAHNDSRHSLWLKGGAPVAARLAELRVSFYDMFIKTELVSEERFENELKQLDRPPEDPGAFIVEKGLIDESRYREILREELIRDFAQICLGAGEMSFEKDAGVPEKLPEIQINLFWALTHVFQYYMTPGQREAIEKKLTGILLLPTSNLHYLLPAMELPPKMKQALATWTTARSLNDFAAVSGLDHRETLALVTILDLVDALQFKKKQASHKPTAEMKGMVQVRASAASEETEKPGSRRKKAKARMLSVVESLNNGSEKKRRTVSDKELSPEWLALKHEIKSKLDIIKTNNPARILGVGDRATHDEIKKAYSDIVSRFHPDKFFGTELETMAEDCTKIFAAAGNALKTLTEPRLREEFIQASSDPILRGDMRKADQLKRAELEIRSAKILFSRRDYKKAISTARRALAIFPYDPSTLVVLAWSIFKTSPDDAQGRENAMNYLERAIKIHSECDVAHFYKAMIHEELGEIDEARRHYELTLKHNSLHAEAKHALARISG